MTNALRKPDCDSLPMVNSTVVSQPRRRASRGRRSSHWAKSRHYEHTTAGYAQADPIGLDGTTMAQMNLYGYAGQNPLRFIDPSGLNIDDPEIPDPANPFHHQPEPWDEHFKPELINPLPSAGPLPSAARPAVIPQQCPPYVNIASDLENLGGGIPRIVPTPKGASQFIFPNGTVVRFDLYPGQYLDRQLPHINIENEDQGIDKHINLRE